MEDRYAFLTEDQWLRVCRLLAEDAAKHGVMSFISPSHPEQGHEIKAERWLETDEMNWLVERTGDKLSDVIILDNQGDHDEIARAAASLVNTIKALHAYIGSAT